jgi:ribosomal protein L37AE/L43A
MSDRTNTVCHLILVLSIIINSWNISSVRKNRKEIKMAEKVQCPNCLEPAEKVGNKITCTACDSVLTITRTGGAKVVQIGRVEKLEKRIGILESLLSPEPEPEPVDEELVETGIEADSEEPILPE